MIKGFRDFIMRGNVVELAVAVAIGTAFAALIEQFGNSFIKPLVAVISGGGLDGGTFRISDQTFDWGAFVNALIFFALTAAVIYFAVVAPLNAVEERRRRRGQAPADTPPTAGGAAHRDPRPAARPAGHVAALTGRRMPLSRRGGAAPHAGSARRRPAPAAHPSRGPARRR